MAQRPRSRHDAATGLRTRESSQRVSGRRDRCAVSHSSLELPNQGEVMDEEQALDLIRPLADGILPTTGEALPADSPFQHPNIVRALYLAVRALEAEAERRTRQRHLPGNAGKPWSTGTQVWPRSLVM